MIGTIKAAEKPLIKVFCDDYLFSIPSYQRPYAWTTDQAGQLLDDLMASLTEDDPGELSPYFLGSIVLIKSHQRSESDVVDGQQRLTTLTTLFCVLRDLEPEKRASQVHRYVCQVGDEFAGVIDQFRLSPRSRDIEFYRENIQEFGATKNLFVLDGLPDSQANLINNASYYRQRLEKVDDATRANLLTFMVQRCFLVVVEASDRASAYRIFSVMNDRGLDLSPTDILKAEIIGALEEEQREAYTEKWEDLEEDLGRDAFRDLFRHVYILCRHDKIRGTLEDQIRIHVKPQDRPAEFIDNELSPLAEAYLTVKKQAFASPNPDAVQINKYLEYLSRLDNSDWEPPATLFMSQNRSNPAALLRFFKDLDRLAYGLFIQRSNINERIVRFGRVVKEIQEGADLYDPGAALQLTAAEQSKILEALDGPIYTMITRVRLPLLLRLDEALSDGSARYDHRIITVEHVLPQKPGRDSQWLEWFPEAQKRHAWVHRLANLVLLSRQKNSRASNFDFERKKNEYFTRGGTSPFAVTTQVIGQPIWTADVLERRQRLLIDKLAELWRIEAKELPDLDVLLA